MTRGIACLPLVGLLLLASGAARAAPGPTRPARVLSLAATSDGPTAYTGETVQFMDTSQGEPTSWSWDFSYDGVLPLADSTEQNPLWTFTEAGLFTIRFEACNEAGCSAAVKQIEVAEPCTASPDLVLTDQTVSDTQELVACQTITASSGFAVVDPGSVTFRAGRSVTLGSGFSVGSGASFRAVIDPALDTP